LTGDCAKWTARFKIYIVPHGETAVMTCSTETEPFVGFFDSTGKAINASDKYHFKKEGNNNILEILNAEESDYGEYMCKDSASEDAATVEIDVQVEPILAQNLAIGFKGTINAEVYGMPRKQMEWYKNGNKIASLDSQGKMIFNELNKYKIDPRGSLIIEEVLSSDKGLYDLKIIKDSSRIEKSANIDVGFKPVITTSPEASYTKTAGQALSIPCQWDMADANPNWTFTPTDSNQSTVIDQSQIDAMKLTLASVATTDEGTYICAASNKYGKSEVSTKITSVITPAAITSKFESTEKLINTEYVLECAASGRPIPKVSIHHLEKELVTGSGFVNTSITISSATAGEYKCLADNGALAVDGSSLGVEKKMNLEMMTPPTITEITDDLSSAVGLSFTVSCVATGNPTPKVTLEQEGKNLSTAKSTLDGQTSSVELLIDSAVTENFKDVTCVATNKHGSVNKTVKVTEVAPPGNVTNVQSTDLTFNTVLVKWDPPQNVEGIDILYRINYCQVVNGTLENCTLLGEQKDDSIQLSELDAGTSYQVQISALNQKVVGHTTRYNFTTLDETVTPSPPLPSNRKKGMATGAIAGIIIAIIIIILLVVDLFCCFFNQCGFSHCCVETLCANSRSSAKYKPTDTKEHKHEEMEELKPKSEDVV